MGETDFVATFGAIRHVMNVKNKTCLFCLKQRQILVDDSFSGKTIQKIYSITLPSEECRICIECHFNLSRIREFKDSIDRCSDFDVDSCFVCKSEKTVSEPGVDRVVDYLLKQCTTIDIGNTDTVRACTTCLYLLEICIKYEKLARNYANCQRFSKQFATIRECNVALGKIDLDTLGDICDSFESYRGRKGKKGKKRSRGSWGGREENASKRSKKEDESVLPVMLTKLTPTMTPARPGKKSLSPDSSLSKKGKAKPNSKIFIKLPGPRKQAGKKHRANRITYESPHSPSIPIPRDPSVDDLNRIFKVELRPLSIRIEHVDLSSYLNRTISHDKDTRQLRKPKKEEFIGLDEEDVVELQQNNISITSVGKRKSILVMDRIESPNSAKKKVKFSDSPSIKYVDKLKFSDDDEDDDSEDQNDADYEGSKPAKKKSQKPQNGNTPENGKPRRGRPKKTKESPSETTNDDTPNAANNSKADETDKSSTDAEPSTTDEKNEEPSASEGDSSEPLSQNNKEETVVENGNSNEEEKLEPTDTPQSVEAVVTSVDTELTEASPDDAPMDTTDDQTSMVVDEMPKGEETTQQVEPVDEEMKNTEPEKSPEDVEMTESRVSPVPEDVEMKEDNAAVENHTENPPEVVEEDNAAVEKEDIPGECAAAELETSKKDDGIEQCLNDMMAEPISDSELSQVDGPSGQEEEKEEPVPSEKNEPEVETRTDVVAEVETAAESEPEPQEEAKPESNEPEEAQNNAELEQDPERELEAEKAPSLETPEKKDLTFSSLDDVDEISDDDGILDQLDEPGENNRKLSPELPPLGEDSL